MELIVVLDYVNIVLLETVLKTRDIITEIASKPRGSKVLYTRNQFVVLFLRSEY